MNSLLLSMPGTPVIYYGDEIGMGDNIHLGDRNGVRTPMQWSPDRNGGFSRADPAALVLPPIMDPLYGYGAVNVEAQNTRSAFHSQLDAAHARGAQPASGFRPRHTDVPISEEPQDPRLSCANIEGETLLCVANVAHSPQAVELDLSSSLAAFRWSSMPARRFRRSANSPICSRCRLTAFTGSRWQRRAIGRLGIRRRPSRCRNS